jgi:hypothetical protein
MPDNPYIAAQVRSAEVSRNHSGGHAQAQSRPEQDGPKSVPEMQPRVDAAKMLASDAPGRGTASHFADWVFATTNPDYRPAGSAYSVAERLAVGRFAHGEIDRLQAWIKCIRAAGDLSTSWKLLYSDPHDESEGRTFLASCLTVDGKPLRCKPDVVFRDMGTGLNAIKLSCLPLFE